ncbi:hypothetical protein Agub_g6365 [Astrephomene gubernaculifera]|uniref:BZIP domain-containing protein n=1 Tax=Astrephomene gubernaculifera TaxID=47775 RepID=A0AAD3HL18_9CHLO|nr:hypothetical protein Agub_g6365 [Astrephomene gubernaculifera]
MSVLPVPHNAAAIQQAFNFNTNNFLLPVGDEHALDYDDLFAFLTDGGSSSGVAVSDRAPDSGDVVAQPALTERSPVLSHQLPPVPAQHRAEAPNPQPKKADTKANRDAVSKRVRGDANTSKNKQQNQVKELEALAAQKIADLERLVRENNELKYRQELLEKVVQLRDCQLRVLRGQHELPMPWCTAQNEACSQLAEAGPCQPAGSSGSSTSSGGCGSGRSVAAALRVPGAACLLTSPCVKLPPVDRERRERCRAGLKSKLGNVSHKGHFWPRLGGGARGGKAAAVCAAGCYPLPATQGAVEAAMRYPTQAPSYPIYLRFRSMGKLQLMEGWKHFLSEVATPLLALECNPADEAAAVQLRQLAAEATYLFKHTSFFAPDTFMMAQQTHLETEQVCSPDPAHWHAVLRTLELNPEQIRDLRAVFQLFSGIMRGILAERRDINAHLATGLHGPHASVQTAMEHLTVAPECEVFKSLQRNMRREKSAHLLLRGFLFGRTLSTLQFVKAAVYSYPWFPDATALTATVAESADADSSNA